jgi:hypothetical protein
MAPKKKKEKKYRKKKHLGSWYKAGQIFVILGGVVAIVAAILALINITSEAIFQSYTFGQLGIDYLGNIIAIVCGAVLIWFAIDKRFVYSIHLIVFAIIIIVIAIVAGNVGGLICIIGGILIIFEYLSKN